ncbi:MAG: hypothetical protein GKC10_04820 [Methanosarcinales archaeon]|nr:hypothetical protein [Methanosarcinales archaeon]
MKHVVRAIVYDGPEDVYGSCGCGMDMAILPVLVPKVWYVEECPFDVEDQCFCRGDDFRRQVGLSANNVFEHEIQDQVYLANFSCCRDCARRAVESGYAVWSEKGYPMVLR